MSLSLLTIIILMAIIASIGVLFLNAMGKISLRPSQVKKHYDISEYEGKTSHAQKSDDDNKFKIRTESLERQISELTSQLNGCDKKIEILSQRIEMIMKPIVEQPSSVRQDPKPEPTDYQQDKQSRKVYIQIVDNPEGFEVDKLRDTPNKFVKFNLILGDQRGTYELTDLEENQRRIMQSFGDIAPYVEKENDSDESIGIECTAAGTLELSDGIWKIVRKAKIRFLKK